MGENKIKQQKKVRKMECKIERNTYRKEGREKKKK